MYLPLIWDDSYIAYRYALNLVENGHWNWNADAEHVEAYTNFSYAFLTVIPILLKMNPKIFFTLLNILWMGIIVYQMKTKLSSFTLFCVALLLTVLNPFIHYHIATGMETIFFLFLIFEAARHLLTKPNNKNAEIYFYFILLLLPLTRPEGALYSIVCFCISLFVNRTKIQSKKALGVIILVAIAYMTWRYIYFERLLPNTFYIKSVKGLSFRNLIHLLNDIKLYIIVLIILNFFVKNKTFFILSILTIFIAVFVYAPSDLVTTTNDRFSIQIFLPLFIVSLFLIPKNDYSSLVVLFVLFFTASFIIYSKIIPFNPQMYYYKEIGRTLSKFSNKNYTLMIGEAGVIPYFSNWKCYDFIGLANRELYTKKISTQYIEIVSPDIIMLYGSGKGSTEMNANIYDQGVIIDYMKNNHTYNFIGNINCNGWCLKVFMKLTIADYQPLKLALEKILAQTYEYEKTLFCESNIRKWFTLQYLK
jgi:hypothetical protein